jgi:hypothetical protein
VPALQTYFLGKDTAPQPPSAAAETPAQS